MSGIDKASVYAERFKQNPQVLQASVLGQGPVDPYTALNALRLIKESNMMAMAGKAQQPTSSPSIVAETLAPAVPQGLGAMVPGAMNQAPRPPMPLPGPAMPPPRPPQAQFAPPSGGLAAMPTPNRAFAGGGIVAFAGNEDSLVEDDDRYGGDAAAVNANGVPVDADGVPMFGSQGDPTTYGALAAMYPGVMKDLLAYDAKTLTPEQRKQARMSGIKEAEEALGPNTAMESLAADIAERKKDRAGALKQGQGLALLQAAAAVAQGNNWLRALGNAGAAFGKEYSRTLEADKVERRSIASAEFHMADAQRKERLGLYKEGRAAEERAMAAKQAAEKARLDKLRVASTAISKGLTATRPYAPKNAPVAKFPELAYQAAIDNLKQITRPEPGESATAYDARIRMLAAREVAPMLKTSVTEIGPAKGAAAVAPTQAKIDKAVSDSMKEWQFSREGAKYQEAKRTGDTVTATKLWKEAEQRFREIHSKAEGIVSGVVNRGDKNVGSAIPDIPPPPAGAVLDKQR
jgi:hypothetical protein